MNVSNFRAIVVIVVAFFLSFFVIIQILTTDGNQLGATYRYLLLASFLAGVFNPKASMVLQILCAGYLDVLKKLLVVGNKLYFGDLFFVLSIPSVMLIGACIGVAARILKPGAFTKRDTSLLIFGIVLTVLSSAAIVAQNGFSEGTLKALATSSSFMALIFVFPILYPKVEDVLKYLKILVLLMIPAAIHGLYHFFNGLMDFEFVYVMSGFTTQSAAVLRGEGVFGPFASQGALSGTMIICAVLCVISFLLPNELRRKKFYLHPTFSIILFILFVAAATLSLKRVPLVVLPLSLVAFFVFRRGWTTAATYFSASLTVVLLVVFSSQLRNNLPKLQSEVNKIAQQNSTAQDLLRVQTFNARLEEFEYLKDGSSWKPFGEEKGSIGVVHSLAVKSILKLGWVPFLGLILISVPILFWFHRHWTKKWNGSASTLSLICFSTVASVYFAAVLGGGFINTAPIPFLVGILLASTIGLAIRPLKEDQEIEPSFPAEQENAVLLEVSKA